MHRFILIALLTLLPGTSHAFDSDESDKQRHMVLSALIVGSAYAVTEDLTTSVLIAFGLGMAKELYDASKKGGRIDPQDLEANVAGVGIGFLWVKQF
jgi:uncharacterized protein YfiM (DUF2279 family)